MSAISVSNAKLYEVAQTICATFLGLDIAECPGGIHAEDANCLTACVLISGAWNGALTVRVSEILARRVASEMFAMADEDLTGDEVQDALGEVANMLGGNVKALIPGRCALSLPTVAQGRCDRLTAPGAARIRAVDCTFDDQPIQVAILERTESDSNLL